MNFPNGLAVDVFGHLYVADTNNHRILRLTPNGNGYTASLVCGVRRGRQTGPALEAELDSPRGIVVGFHNNLYVADSNANRILWVGPAHSLASATPTTNSPFAPVVLPAAEGGLEDIETVSDNLPPLEALHASSSLPSEVTDLAEQMERHEQDTPAHRENLSGQVAVTPAPAPAPALVQPEAVPAVPPPGRPRHVAATVLGWGIELSGNNLIRTEPDGSLLLDTTYSVENSAFFYLPWEVTSEQKVIIEVRMQLVAYVGERDATGCAVWFENDRHADALLIQPEGIRLLRVLSWLTPAIPVPASTPTPLFCTVQTYGWCQRCDMPSWGRPILGSAICPSCPCLAPLVGFWGWLCNGRQHFPVAERNLPGCPA